MAVKKTEVVKKIVKDPKVCPRCGGTGLETPHLLCEVCAGSGVID